MIEVEPIPNATLGAKVAHVEIGRGHGHPGQPCVLHRGRTWPGDQARVMARTTVAGDEAGNEWSL